MTNYVDLFLRLIPALLVTLLAMWDYKTQFNEKNKTVQQFANFLLVVLLLDLLLVLFFELIYKGNVSWKDYFLPFLLEICLVWLVYDGILVLLMPFFRRYFTASTCAYLWLIPNFLYIVIHISTSNYDIFSSSSSHVIYIPSACLPVFFLIWLTGTVLIAGKMFWDNHIFQKRLMRDAHEVVDNRILSEFLQMKHHFDPLGKIKLYYSPATHTPVSIGMGVSSMKVILPERDYTRDELHWIFRHEITHLRKNDCSLKFFLSMTNAIFWFIPFTWMASRMLTEDQELSCDEMVLAGCRVEDRRNYANLILNTAGDSKGFSTCLSAKAESMRYRLKNVMKPSYHGGIHNILLIGFMTFLMILSFFTVEFTFTAGNADQLIFSKDDWQRDCHMEEITLTYNDGEEMLDDYIMSFDEKEWIDYLTGLKLKKIRSGHYNYKEPYDIQIRFTCKEASTVSLEKEFYLNFNGKYMSYWEYGGDSESYLLPDDDYKKLIDKADILEIRKFEKD